jgi:dTDP-4-amino-4,6-dideoxygalactose transaminase
MGVEMTGGNEEHLPFNLPSVVGTEQAYIAEAIARGQLSAGGLFTERCCQWLEASTRCRRALLVHSATAALEMIALLLDIDEGDEVVMPSFNFVSAANAIVLRRGTPVFVDVRADTLNIDEQRIEGAITSRTKAVLAMHYAGVPCEMDSIRDVAARHDLLVIEDAAHALGSSYRGRPAGGLGDLAALSFHETKNLSSGEGGALLVNEARLAERAEILRDKGTDRSRFFRGEVDKYSWVDLGSSYALSELNAAFLWGQFEAADALDRERRRAWDLYHAALEPLENEGLLRRTVFPDHVEHNAHIYYVLVGSRRERARVLRELRAREVHAVFHYVPLHDSAAGRRFGRVDGSLANTEDLAHRLIRLPLWSSISESQIARVVETLGTALGSTAASTLGAPARRAH